MTQEEFSRRGGIARAKKFTTRERAESARLAAKARWAKSEQKRAEKAAKLAAKLAAKQAAAKVKVVVRKRRRVTIPTPGPVPVENWSA